MVDNTSATGGPLLPTDLPQPLEGQELRRFIQQWLVGVLGLDGSMVRPAAQSEPPNIPDAGNAWVSFAILGRPADTFPAVIHKTDVASPEGFDELQRNEQVRLLVTCYDLGTNGLADVYATLLRDGLAIPQNLAPLYLEGFKLNSVGDLVEVPVLVKSRWQYRVDLPIFLIRQITRQYRVKNLIEANGEIVTSAGLVLNIDTDELLPPEP
jgi:hypothetical protein